MDGLFGEVPNWFEFLRLETELALTFIQSAKLYLENPLASSRALDRARKALEEVQRRLENPDAYGLNTNEVEFLENRCVAIKSELGAG